jgi:4-hydroxy-3-polyprenylbenzoate decarboxylase
MSAERAPCGPRYTVAVTGASGALYAVRTVAALLELGCELDLVVSDFGRRLLADELGKEAALERLLPYLEQKYGTGVRNGRYDMLSNRDLGATIASGSRPTKGMVIVPCSMKSLAGVANGLSRNLVERAADVMLKERKPLVLVPRETPMSLPQLRNMVRCAEAGAVVLPAMPGFYHLPRTLDDLADFLAGRILAALGLEQRLCADWTGRVER